jgi:hypothetical protein
MLPALLLVLQLVALVFVWIAVFMQWKFRREATRHLATARQLHADTEQALAQIERGLAIARRTGLELDEHHDA